MVGTGVAVAFSDGRISLLVPEDEEDLAKRSWADEVRTFKPGSLNELITTAEAIRNPLREVAQSFSAELARAGGSPRSKSAHVDKAARDALEARGYPPLRHGDDH